MSHKRLRNGGYAGKIPAVRGPGLRRQSAAGGGDGGTGGGGHPGKYLFLGFFRDFVIRCLTVVEVLDKISSSDISSGWAGGGFLKGLILTSRQEGFLLSSQQEGFLP